MMFETTCPCVFDNMAEMCLKARLLIRLLIIASSQFLKKPWTLYPAILGSPCVY